MAATQNISLHGHPQIRAVNTHHVHNMSQIHFQKIKKRPNPNEHDKTKIKTRTNTKKAKNGPDEGRTRDLGVISTTL